MEPQLIRGEKATRQPDIWSLGITLHRALSGEGVHGEIDDRNMMAALRHVLREPPCISDRIPKAFRSPIERCIEPDAGDRFGTSEELAAAIETAMADPGEAARWRGSKCSQVTGSSPGEGMWSW
jgi:serine/threonine protein kinase